MGKKTGQKDPKFGFLRRHIAEPGEALSLVTYKDQKRKKKDKIKRSVSFHTHSLSKYISYIAQQFTEDHLKCFCCVEISSAATNLWIFRISNWLILQILKEVALWPPAHRDDLEVLQLIDFSTNICKRRSS